MAIARDSRGMKSTKAAKPNRGKKPAAKAAVCGIFPIAEARRLTGRIIYGLCGSDAEIFYVGQTRNPRRRFADHAQANTENAALRARLKACGDLHVAILEVEPPDLNEAERRHILLRGERLLNLVGADSAVWAIYSDKPWAAGSGILAPSAAAMQVASPPVKAEVRERLRRMSGPQRCLFEIDLYFAAPPLRRERLDRWLNITRPKMVACLEAAQAAGTI